MEWQERAIWFPVGENMFGCLVCDWIEGGRSYHGVAWVAPSLQNGTDYGQDMFSTGENSCFMIERHSVLHPDEAKNISTVDELLPPHSSLTCTLWTIGVRRETSCIGVLLRVESLPFYRLRSVWRSQWEKDVHK